MITPSEILNKAGKKYNEYLRSLVSDIPFTEIVITGNKKPGNSLSVFQQEIASLIENSKEKKGYGYSVKYRTVRKKNLGTQDIPKEISFQTESDFLKYLHREKEVENFRKDSELILLQFPELKEWIIKYPAKVIGNHSQWTDLLKVCSYFKANPKPDLYIRALPIHVHTKFIEQNKYIIRELLDILIKSQTRANERDFEKRFNLKYLETTVRFRVLDKNISRQYFSGIDDLSIPISQFERLSLPVRNVFIVENQTNLLTVALTLPELEEAIVLFGSGYKVENLKNTKWLKKVNLFYWGDLDIQGFEILSRFRGYFPNTQSILMNKTTFDRYFENAIVEGKSNKVVTLNLTSEEQELYELLEANNWRLEQEKIALEYVTEIITAKIM
ncbi:MAG: DUF2220 family protein [Prevotellaceae bacterium]|jgi:hypothetical protein|nr:DUF2220 family protein [Prevotellaceae bacterium]